MKPQSVIGLLVGLLALAGCAQPAERPSFAEVKAATQSMERELAGATPEGVFVKFAQAGTGELSVCRRSWYRWHGDAVITVAAGTDTDAIIQDFEDHFTKAGYETHSDPDVFRQHRLGITDPETGTTVRVATGFAPDQIRLSSASECFFSPGGEAPEL